MSGSPSLDSVPLSSRSPEFCNADTVNGEIKVGHHSRNPQGQGGIIICAGWIRELIKEQNVFYHLNFFEVQRMVWRELTFSKIEYSQQLLLFLFIMYYIYEIMPIFQTRKLNFSDIN